MPYYRIESGVMDCCYCCYCRGLVLCHLDAGHKEDAEKVCISAVYLVKNHVPEKLDALIRLQVS